jgi:hypothetical protein
VALTERMDSMAERMDAESIVRKESDARLDKLVCQFSASLPPTSLA